MMKKFQIVWEDSPIACICLLGILLTMILVWGHGFIW